MTRCIDLGFKLCGPCDRNESVCNIYSTKRWLDYNIEREGARSTIITLISYGSMCIEYYLTILRHFYPEHVDTINKPMLLR